jgi:hypothetical protein
LIGVRHRLAAGALLLVSGGAGLLLATTASVVAAPCAGEYAAQLHDIEAQLAAGAGVAGLVDRLRELGTEDGAGPALAPVITELEAGQLPAAEARLQAMSAALRPASGSGCAAAETGAARQALSGVYRSPAFAGLDQTSSASWLQQLVDAVGNFLSRAVGSVGRVALLTITAVIVAAVLGFAAWRLRQVTASGREPSPVGTAAPDGLNPDAEWARAVSAAERGEFREAVRRAFRSALLSLSLRGRLTVQPAWTSSELIAHARGDPELVDRLAPAAGGFDRAWYSGAAVGRADWETIREDCQAVRRLAAGGRAETPR